MATIADKTDTTPGSDTAWTAILALLDKRCPGIAAPVSPAGLRNLRAIGSCRDAMEACREPVT